MDLNTFDIPNSFYLGKQLKDMDREELYALIKELYEELEQTKIDKEYYEILSMTGKTM